MDGAEVQKKIIISTKDEIEQFKKSFIWQDIHNILEERIEDHIRQLLFLPENAHTGGLPPGSLEIRMGGYNGTIKALDWVARGLLNDLIISIENMANEPKEDSAETSENKKIKPSSWKFWELWKTKGEA